MRIGRLGLVTPYTAEVQERIVAEYRALGIEVVAERHLATTDNFAFGEVSEARIAELCREVATAADPPEAVAVVCTNMRGPLVAPDLERELGLPVLDSVAFTLWAVLASAGVSTSALARFGRLFEVDGRALTD
jgi:maleate isomerase